MSRHHHLGFEEDNRQYYDNIGAIEMDSSQPLHLKSNSGAAPCLLLGLAEIAIKGDGVIVELRCKMQRRRTQKPMFQKRRPIKIWYYQSGRSYIYLGIERKWNQMGLENDSMAITPFSWSEGSVGEAVCCPPFLDATQCPFISNSGALRSLNAFKSRCELSAFSHTRHRLLAVPSNTAIVTVVYLLKQVC